MSTSPSSSESSNVPDGLAAPRRHWAVAVQLTGIVMTVLDSSITNVALPTIARALQASPADAIWIVNAYNVTLLVTLLPLSALGERVGFRRVFAIGLALYTCASLACALADSLLALALARVAQGLGAAATMAVMAGLMRHIYPLRLLGRGIGLNAMFVGAAGALGPTASSAILAVAEWPWLYAINVPIGLVALLGVRYLPDSLRSRNRFDTFGALLSGVMLTLFVIGLDRLVANPGYALAAIGVGVMLAYFVLHRSRTRASPLWPLDLFRIPQFAYGLAGWLFMFASQVVAFVAMPFYFLSVFGRDQVEVGLLMTAWPICSTIVAPIAGRLADRHEISLLCALGAGVLGIALLVLLLLPASVGDVWIVAVMAACGVGFGFFHSPNNRALLASVPLKRVGAAGGMQSTTRTFSQSVGAALVAIAFGLSATHGPFIALIMAIVCSVGGFAVNVVHLRADRASS